MLIQLRGKVRRAVIGVLLSEDDRAALASARQGARWNAAASASVALIDGDGPTGPRDGTTAVS